MIAVNAVVQIECSLSVLKATAPDLRSKNTHIRDERQLQMSGIQGVKSHDEQLGRLVSVAGLGLLTNQAHVVKEESD